MRTEGILLATALVLAVAGIGQVAVMDRDAGTAAPAATVGVATEHGSPGTAPAEPSPLGAASADQAAAVAPPPSASPSTPDGGAGATSAAAPAPGTVDAPAAQTGDLPVTLSVTPACAKPGDRLVARVAVPPGSHVSLVVAYADGRNHGEMYAGPTSPDGSLAYPWVVPTAAARGEGRVLVAAHDPADRRSGTTGTVFLIEGARTC